MRLLGIGLVAALATAIRLQGSPPVEAADGKKSGLQLGKEKKAGGLKAKGSGEGAKSQRRITDCEGSTYLSQQLLATSCRAK